MSAVETHGRLERFTETIFYTGQKILRQFSTCIMFMLPWFRPKLILTYGYKSWCQHGSSMGLSEPLTWEFASYHCAHESLTCDVT